MNRQELVALIRRKKSFLCVGLDSDINKIPKHLLTKEDPVFEFNKAIIDATLPYTVAYKPNLAFYESRGIEGLVSLKKTMDYLHQFKDECFTIADAKRGDIGNTSEQYAKAFLSEEGDWYKVSYVTNGKALKGYIRKDMLSVEGEISEEKNEPEVKEEKEEPKVEENNNEQEVKEENNKSETI